ncbi:MAG: hypothetical protein JO296_08400 [Pseudonocardiales bacterium]|nr:hypothetical protein [Pseudonocardiales bacterium]
MNPEDQTHGQPHKITKRDTPRHPDPEAYVAPTARRMCKISKCGRELYALDRCRGHYERWIRFGNDFPDVPIRRGARLGVPGYRAAHAAVRAVRGPAAAWPCSVCGDPAVSWCYDRTDPAELVEAAQGRHYSVDPARYVPRCRGCRRRPFSQATSLGVAAC